MKRVILTISVLALMASGAGALADDVPDGEDCAAGESGVTQEADETDRGAICVNDGDDNVLLYAGGEVQTEESGGNPCGAVIVKDEVLFGAKDWDNEGSNPDDPSDDEHCD